MLQTTLIETIRGDSLAARKLRDAFRANLLVTLLAEAQTVGKNAKPPRETTDEETLAVIKKFYKNAEANGIQVMTAQRPGYIDEFGRIKSELDILETYIPKQLSEDEIRIIIDGLKVGEIMEPTIGNIQGYFKKMYPGQYDGATVARLAR